LWFSVLFLSFALLYVVSPLFSRLLFTASNRESCYSFANLPICVYIFNTYIFDIYSHTHTHTHTHIYTHTSTPTCF
jgi:hypothetical protein